MPPLNVTPPGWSPVAARAAEFFDRIAPHYDAWHSDRACRTEDRALRRLLAGAGIRRARRIADLGCGTGLLLRLFPELERFYVGVDVSARMVGRAQEAFPLAAFLRAEMVEWLERPLKRRRYDFITSLFCAPNYVPPGRLLKAIRHALAPGGRVFLMALRPGRRPLIHTREMDALLYRWDPEEVLELMDRRGFVNVAARPFAFPPSGAWELLAPEWLLVLRQTLGAALRDPLDPGAGRYVIYSAIRG